MQVLGLYLITVSANYLIISSLVMLPVDSAGNKVPKAKDAGKLPFGHPAITFLADLMHRIRCFGKYVFGAGTTIKTCYNRLSP